MDTPRNFRSAFHGFNREDVVHYLEYINARHTAQVNQLTAEAEELRSRKPGADEQAQSQIGQLQAKCQDLEAQLEQARTENARLMTLCETLEAQAAAAQEAPAPQPSEDQLEIYRRAQRTEQEARERAELTYFQSNGVLTEAAAKVEGVAAQITQQTDAVMSQITQLQVAVSDSKRVLQDAASMMKAIRP